MLLLFGNVLLMVMTWTVQMPDGSNGDVLVSSNTMGRMIQPSSGAAKTP
jgi:hypothetical protein